MAYEPVGKIENGRDAGDFAVPFAVEVARLVTERFLYHAFPANQMKEAGAWMSKNKTVPLLCDAGIEMFDLDSPVRSSNGRSGVAMHFIFHHQRTLAGVPASRASLKDLSLQTCQTAIARSPGGNRQAACAGPQRVHGSLE